MSESDVCICCGNWIGGGKPHETDCVAALRAERDALLALLREALPSVEYDADAASNAYNREACNALRDLAASIRAELAAAEGDSRRG